MADEAEVPEMSMQDALRLSANPDNMEPVTDTPPPVIVPEDETIEPAETVVPETPVTVPDTTVPPTPIATPVTETPVTPPAEPPAFDETAWIKQHFGEDYTIDALKAKVTAPAPEPTYKEPEFVNEASKKLYEAILAGKETEVADYLQQKQFLNSLATRTPEEVIKAGLKAEFGLTDAQADRRVSKQYEVDDLLDDEDKEIEEKIIAKKMEAEAERYKTYFATQAAEITLPSIAQPEAQNLPTEPEISEAAQSAFTYAQKLAKSVGTDMVNVPYQVKDESLGIDFKGKVQLPQTEIDEIKANLQGHGEQYLAARYIKPDGTFDNDLFARLVYVDANLDKIVQAAVIDAKTQTWKAKMKADKNYQENTPVIQGDFDSDPLEEKRKAYRAFWG